MYTIHLRRNILLVVLNVMLFSRDSSFKLSIFRRDDLLQPTLEVEDEEEGEEVFHDPNGHQDIPHDPNVHHPTIFRETAPAFQPTSRPAVQREQQQGRQKVLYTCTLNVRCGTPKP